MAFRCLLCHPAVVDCADHGNMMSHLGAVRLLGHNMGSFRCQHPGCTLRSVRGTGNQRHGNHNAAWQRDQTLAVPLADLARQCQTPWAPGVFPLAAQVPVAAQGPPAIPLVPAAAVVPVAPVPVVVPVPAPAPVARPAPLPPLPPLPPYNLGPAPLDVEALAQDVDLMQWISPEVEEEQKKERPPPAFFLYFGLPYGTGPDIPGGR